MISVNAKAQIQQCIDSNLIQMNRYLICDTTWAPECGCNNVTYRNDCQRLQSGVTSTTDRTCEDITIVYLYPNPADQYIKYRIYLKQIGGNATVFIYDAYGNVHYTKYFLGISDDIETLDVTGLPTGVYIFVAIANGHFAEKKFVKVQY